MIGYLIEQELGNLLPAEVPLATLLTMIEVDADDPAFDDPDEVRRAGLRRGAGRALAAEKGWVFKRTASTCVAWCRRRRRSASSRSGPIRWLLEHGTVVICAGGGGIPTTWVPGQGTHARRRRGRDRQGPRQRAARPRDRRGPVHHGHRRRRRLRGLGHAGPAPARPRDARRAAGACTSPPARWARRSRPRRGSSRQPASGPRSARWRTSRRSSTARAGTNGRVPVTRQEGER